ncbi:MAG TPA: alpha-amylase family glycosyl hydrolase [Actinophytocola sp.]|uniref:alpha-amylase family glycosyl hydrolase n=1 Tax=Actinophytocola sp. TaxID=1872138 RepID=UPI002DDD6971|nr:alpha-amylase family glycosyl hydrolase [Actinophytocola sp.]HEV2780465.1 alpha-amylase family glycosyl hydrolase [Actinophytocola sp.]
MSARRVVTALLSALVASSLAVTPAAAEPDHGDRLRGLHSLRGPVTDENFYFVMADRFDNGDPANDRGGLPDDRLVSGFDPTSKGFYNGGDLRGLLNRIDYIRGLGTTSIWLTPSFKNKPVQLEDGPSAGYHGYWITDFTQIDPHLGTNAELRALVDAAHARGMKVYFDIITNHTADVIGYQQGARRPYVSKDAAPYRTASGQPFDDRDFAGGNGFPALDPATSFPYTPVLDEAERNLKVPAWLNDVTLYHNRGDTTFVGEDSLYGDFFGLDDLFTENPRVVEGMIDIYQRWIADFGVDGFRIDTMKHVNDELWQQFGPRVLRFAREHGKREFFMFGEVFDTTKSFTSQFTTKDRMQSVLDFPFQAAARDFASRGAPTTRLETFFADDDWYTDADSNAYQLPTFLGNHDMGRFGGFVQQDNPGAGDAEWVGRDRLAHELMYFSRGNPVIYYGDEQGFTGSGGDQLARQTLFASRVPDYLDDDLLGTDATHARSNFNPGHPLYQSISRLAAVTRAHPALRDGTHQHRLSGPEAGIYAFSRIDREQQREYVVALNNSEQAKTAAIPTYAGNRNFQRVYGDGPGHARSAADGSLTLTVPPLSTVVYAMAGRIPGSKAAPAISLGNPAPAAESRGRMQVSATVNGSSFYEVTFYAKVGGRWEPIGTDDTAPYRVFHDVSSLPPGTGLQYRAVVLDNRGHTATSGVRGAVVPAPAVTIETPREGSGVRGTVEVRAVADPERATHVVGFERSVDGGAWTPIGTDSSSPAYTVFDDLGPLGLAAGTPVSYRAKLTEPNGVTATSAVRTVRAAGPPATLATLHYFRPAGDYTDWGLHMWGDAVDPAVLAQIAWDRPWPLTRIEGGWAEYDIPLVDDTKPVNFIMHLPSGDTVPVSREPGGDRSFLPIDTPQVWIKQGDPTVYSSQPPTG